MYLWGRAYDVTITVSLYTIILLYITHIKHRYIMSSFLVYVINWDMSVECNNTFIPSCNIVGSGLNSNQRSISSKIMDVQINIQGGSFHGRHSEARDKQGTNYNHNSSCFHILLFHKCTFGLMQSCLSHKPLVCMYIFVVHSMSQEIFLHCILLL